MEDYLKMYYLPTKNGDIPLLCYSLPECTKNHQKTLHLAYATGSSRQNVVVKLPWLDTFGTKSGDSPMDL